MPLNSPEDYALLGEHLSQLDPQLAEFAAQYGYTVCPKHSGGRYPNRRITQEGRLLRSIVIQMECDGKGERYDSFFPDIPYSIWGGTWIDDVKQATRWSGPSILIERIPFSTLTRTFYLHLSHFHDYLSRVTESYILECGRISRLG
ncbi:MAG TPA: hypothetical protein VHC44_02385 [Verrucomicrobiae bacterium]|nr:hypothetical protein [Verrucomicrobiae bacterium]